MQFFSGFDQGDSPDCNIFSGCFSVFIKYCGRNKGSQVNATGITANVPPYDYQCQSAYTFANTGFRSFSVIKEVSRAFGRRSNGHYIRSKHCIQASRVSLFFQLSHCADAENKICIDTVVIDSVFSVILIFKRLAT